MPDVPLRRVDLAGAQGGGGGEEAGAPTTSREALGRGKMVLVSFPGAFTPVCSSAHLPGFLAAADKFPARGIALALIAVNDPFVMKAWAAKLDVKAPVVVLADGNGDFTRAVGLALDMREKGLGERSKRYALLLQDGVVQRVFMEEQANDLEVTDAAHVLAEADALWGGSGKAEAAAAAAAAGGAEAAGGRTGQPQQAAGART